MNLNAKAIVVKVKVGLYTHEIVLDVMDLALGGELKTTDSMGWPVKVTLEG